MFFLFQFISTFWAIFYWDFPGISLYPGHALWLHSYLNNNFIRHPNPGNDSNDIQEYLHHKFL
mgnify:FL=1